MSGLFLIAAQCNTSPTPPLPTTPTGPVIRVALLSPSTGQLATFGRLMRNGSIMAFDEWNERGGILGHHLEWTVYDTNCDFATAQQAAEKAIAEGHQFILGPICSEAAIAAAAIADPAQVLMISPTATHPLVTVDGQNTTRATIFRASYVWSWQAKAAARFARDDLAAGKVALLVNPTDHYATTLTETFAQQFISQGGEIVYQGSYTSDPANLADILTAIGQAGADLIYLPGDAAAANRVARQWRDLTSSETNLTLLGSDSWESAELDQDVTAGSYFSTHFVLDDNRPIVQTWRDAYKSTYAVEPDTLATAISQTGTFEPAAVANTLEQGTFEVVTGPITFDDQHNPAKPVPIVRVERGGIVFATLIWP